MIAAPPRWHIVTERCVFTYQPDGWPVGMYTGFVNEAVGFVLEHVVVFPSAPRGTLLRMLRAALDEARDYSYVTFHIPGRFPLRDGLVAVGRRLGFVEYAPGYWVHHP